MEILNRKIKNFKEKISDFKKENIELLIAEREKIKEKIIKGNLRLVVKIANDFANEHIELIDLISEGNIGLIEGIERYNYKRGVKLSTYVNWWIKERIRNALLTQTHTIKIPKYVIKLNQKYKKIAEDIINNLNLNADFEELKSKFSFSIDNFIEILEYTKEPISLESSIDGKHELKEMIEDVDTMTPFEIVYHFSVIEKLQNIIKKLKHKEQIVVNMRFGIGTLRSYKLKEIAEYLGLSTERVRQILKSALIKLKREIINAGII